MPTLTPEPRAPRNVRTVAHAIVQAERLGVHAKHYEFQALYGMADAPRIHGCLAGVGGVNVPPQRIVGFVQQALQRQPHTESQWVR